MEQFSKVQSDSDRLEPFRLELLHKILTSLCFNQTNCCSMVLQSDLVNPAVSVWQDRAGCWINEFCSPRHMHVYFQRNAIMFCSILEPYLHPMHAYHHACLGLRMPDYIVKT